MQSEPMTAHGRRWMSVGRSTLPDSQAAAAEAVRAALRRPGDVTALDPASVGAAKLLVVFCSNRHDLPALLATIDEISGGVPLVGCSTAGEISVDGPTDHSVVIAALGGEGFSVSTRVCAEAGRRPRVAGAEIAACAADVADRDHKVLMLLIDGFAQGQEEILRGVYGVVGASVPLVGGCAAEESHLGATTQLYGTQVLHDAAIAVAIGSDAPFGIGIKHGWRKVGDAMVVTSSHKGWVNTLDDRPALDAYLDRVGAPHEAYQDFATFLPYSMNRPLGIRRRSGDEVRGVTGHTNVETRSLHCGGEISQGSLIWCMEGDAQTMLDATDDACREALNAIGDRTPLGFLAFDCSGRRNVLGDEGIDDEVARIAKHAAGAPVAGFYSFGEIARTRGINGFHHQTLVVLAVA
ncbi:MAG: FIST signal transduction protein [Acidothermaceae bacterium]